MNNGIAIDPGYAMDALKQAFNRRDSISDAKRSILATALCNTQVLHRPQSSPEQVKLDFSDASGLVREGLYIFMRELYVSIERQKDVIGPVPCQYLGGAVLTVVEAGQFGGLSYYLNATPATRVDMTQIPSHPDKKNAPIADGIISLLDEEVCAEAYRCYQGLITVSRARRNAGAASPAR